MSVNRNKPDNWKEDIAKSVDFYNEWFLKFAPKAYRDTRKKTTIEVQSALKATNNLRNISTAVLRSSPSVLPMLRMSTCPPIARDRLIGLGGISPNLVKVMELDNKLPSRMKPEILEVNLEKIGRIIEKMADPDIFVWLSRKEPETDLEVERAATVIADRLCGAVADPIIRNAQEQRQLKSLKIWLEEKGYRELKKGEVDSFEKMPPGTFSFRFNVPVFLENEKKINIPVDALIMKKNAVAGELPILIEAKSAGDFANVNKRRKEEAAKMSQLKSTYGNEISFNMFLCGYFDSGYLGYEAAEGIDWIWEHRIDDLNSLGL